MAQNILLVKYFENVACSIVSPEVIMNVYFNLSTTIHLLMVLILLFKYWNQRHIAIQVTPASIESSVVQSLSVFQKRMIPCVYIQTQILKI